MPKRTSQPWRTNRACFTHRCHPRACPEDPSRSILETSILTRCRSPATTARRVTQLDKVAACHQSQPPLVTSIPASALSSAAFKMRTLPALKVSSFRSRNCRSTRFTWTWLNPSVSARTFWFSGQSKSRSVPSPTNCRRACYSVKSCAVLLKALRRPIPTRRWTITDSSCDAARNIARLRLGCALKIGLRFAVSKLLTSISVSAVNE